MEIKQNEDYIISKIQKEKPYFNARKFIEIGKMKVATLYRILKSGHLKYINNVCTKNFSKELVKSKNKGLNIDDELDFISVQRGIIRDFRRYEDYDEIDVNFFVFYIDYMYNNKTNYNAQKKRYFNNTYLVTFQVPMIENYHIDNNICPQCRWTFKKDIKQFHLFL